MSNCGVGSGGFGLPGDVVAQHGVEGCDHLAHDGNDDDFGLFVGGGEATVEDFESRIVSASAQSCHVEHVTDWQPTTVLLLLETLGLPGEFFLCDREQTSVVRIV